MTEKRGGDDASDKLLLKKALRKKIDYLTNKPNINPVEAYNLVQDFFRAFTNKEYAYTREELVKELDKVYLEKDVKQKLVNVVKTLGQVEFCQPDLSNQEINELLSDFSEAVEHMIHAETKNLGLWEKFAKKLKAHVSKHEKLEKNDEEEDTPINEFLDEADQVAEEEPDIKDEEEEILANTPSSQQTDPSAEETQRPSYEDSYEQMSAGEDFDAVKDTDEDIDQDESETDDEFYDLLESLYENIEAGEYEIARLDYEELSDAYRELSVEEQRKVYPKLEKAYDELNNH